MRHSIGTEPRRSAAYEKIRTVLGMTDPGTRPELAGLATDLRRADKLLVDALSVSSWERNASWATKFAKYIKGQYARHATHVPPTPYTIHTRPITHRTLSPSGLGRISRRSGSSRARPARLLIMGERREPGPKNCRQVRPQGPQHPAFLHGPAAAS